jgi:hypothetical protein
MNQMSRATGLKIAAVILWAIALTGMAAVGIPILTGARTDAEGPFFWLVIFSFAVDSITMVVAYGVWRAERWAVILAIVISVFNAILNTGGAIGDPQAAMRMMAGTLAVASLVVIYLCLRQAPKPLAESV